MTKIISHKTNLKNSHVPVLAEEVIKNLNIRDGLTYVDGTFGAGANVDLAEPMEVFCPTRPSCPAGSGCFSSFSESSRVPVTSATAASASGSDSDESESEES